MKITFIGFGHFGRAVASLLEHKEDIEIRAWDTAATGHSCQIEDVEEAVKGAELVIFGVPSAFFADCLKGIKGIPESAVLVSGTKGIDAKSGKLPFEMLEEAFPKNQVAVLSGPMLADELEKGIQTCGTVAARDRKTFAVVLGAFENTSLKLCFSKDILGVALAGVLKNVYTLAFGLSDGLKMGANFKSCVVVQAIREMQTIIQVIGGEAGTMMTHAGIGDLLATGYSDASRNYQYGFSVGAEEKLESRETVEGIGNIDTVLSKLPDKNSFPLMIAIEDIFMKNAEAKERLLEAFKIC
ncbi:hypothetical protein CO057_02805 [Candidatus Uhrbacteria bacterium CG_4_9_14_0_2_um_filter_41_50]|uniref:Glycerol-3-phosphate dehydrogenase (NAD(P)(+)) n=1 Tax=Candidatus Uhrbacteria bacterium CG_4_9_14_0_2_um_filter_41_50 TaxID=1975031 RepID=A0A2M8ENW8_9BACT|nr:MAG: hypothetical protein COZ45_02670 [Candidatus Uhrbacteria bacterium CG_4_10_14_3_um_filter_41_21]PIZ54571.1 MAG: hypothetical protein COY24_03320 [Candidatus Uhrbacteria bacterium CG_4_10_14_0_2_um_filter_41_21]PJB84498.1 MAG: hypothetical protein CO086_03325 [Candidatus Uhrbacteria bacterium CG_4_9_14_0_8_um_filter_41_16]PJC24446.1 MAG: hypothetical protein CO057_02805 [Candidatus Uhrbacteria bacterium CG_4_9_14_0_2_um_filter_41_50]PJE75099.1 MAG: hypothetical protein COV03_01945 [Candi